jgi:hypothetical protein
MDLSAWLILVFQHLLPRPSSSFPNSRLRFDVRFGWLQSHLGSSSGHEKTTRTLSQHRQDRCHSLQPVENLGILLFSTEITETWLLPIYRLFTSAHFLIIFSLIPVGRASALFNLNGYLIWRIPWIRYFLIWR